MFAITSSHFKINSIPKNVSIPQKNFAKRMFATYKLDNLVDAIKQVNHKEMKQILDSKDVNPNDLYCYDSLLTIAVRTKNIASVRLLLDHGVNPEPSLSPQFKTPTPIEQAAYWASMQNQEDIIKLLIQRGANIDPIRCERTPLIYALQRYDFVTASLLLELKANIDIGKPFARNFRYDGNSLVHMLARIENTQIGLSYLFEQKMDIDLQNDDGSTPLLSAILAGQTKNALHLLDLGANPDIPDNKGMTPRKKAALCNLKLAFPPQKKITGKKIAMTREPFSVSEFLKRTWNGESPKMRNPITLHELTFASSEKPELTSTIIDRVNAGENPFLPNGKGNTAIGIAIAGQNKPLQGFFKKYFPWQYQEAEMKIAQLHNIILKDLDTPKITEKKKPGRFPYANLHRCIPPIQTTFTGQEEFAKAREKFYKRSI